MIGWTLIAVFTLAIGQDAANHEPIHPADRVFTAEEFRQHLQWIRGQQKILDAVQNMKVSPDNQKKMADFAQRLLEQSQKSGPKQDLPIPESLTKDPALQKLLRDEKFLDWLANNERMQKMAERLASKFNLPKSQPPITPNAPFPGPNSKRGPSPQSDPSRGSSNSGFDPSRGLGSDSDPSHASSAPRPDDSRGAENNRNGDRPNRRTVSSNQQRQRSQNRLRSSSNLRSDNNEEPIDGNSGNPFESQANNSSSKDGKSSTHSPGNERSSSDNGMTHGSDVDPSRHSVLRKMTDAMRKVGPLQNSPALDRVDDLMGKEPIVPDRIATPPSSNLNTQWIEQTLKSDWLDSPWVTNLPKSLENIPLPTGWENSAIPLDKIPIPAFPRTDWVLPSSGVPPVPGVNLSVGKVWTFNGWSAPILLLVAGITLFLLRSFLAGELGLSGKNQSAGIFKTKPSAPFDPHQRESIRQWFEYLVLSRLGQAARPRTHAQLAHSLSAGAMDHRESAERLAELYAEARYLPPQDDLDANLTRHAEQDLARFTTAKSIDTIKTHE